MTRVRILMSPTEPFHLPDKHNQKSHGNRAGKKDNVPGKTSKHAPLDETRPSSSDEPRRQESKPEPTPKRQSRPKYTPPKKSAPAGPMTAETFRAREANAAHNEDVFAQLPVDDSVDSLDKLASAGKLSGTSVDEVREAYLTYTDFNYIDINNALREGDTSKLAPNEKKTITQLDRMMDLSRTKKDIIVMRGIKSPRAVFGNAFIENGGPDANRGLTWIDGAFTSTTAKDDVAKGFGSGVIMHILVPKGSRATGTPDSEYPGEREVILARGTKFRVVSSRRESALKPMILQVEVVND